MILHSRILLLLSCNGKNSKHLNIFFYKHIVFCLGIPTKHPSLFFIIAPITLRTPVIANLTHTPFMECRPHFSITADPEIDTALETLLVPPGWIEKLEKTKAYLENTFRMTHLEDATMRICRCWICITTPFQ